jgi:hypothetical protein
MNECRNAEPTDPSRRADRQIVLVVGLSLLSWMTILAAHYVANGRAVFDRGNGLLYPNPSDADANAPVIYFHWLPWILGAVVTQLSIAPGTA